MCYSNTKTYKVHATQNTRITGSDTHECQRASTHARTDARTHTYTQIAIGEKVRLSVDCHHFTEADAARKAAANLLNH